MKKKNNMENKRSKKLQLAKFYQKEWKVDMNHQRNSKIMTKEEAFLIVKDSVVSILNCDANTLTMKSNFVEDLEADSLDRVNLIIEYEVMLGRNIPIDMVRELRTVGQAVDYIMKLCNEQAS